MKRLPEEGPDRRLLLVDCDKIPSVVYLKSTHRNTALTLKHGLDIEASHGLRKEDLRLYLNRLPSLAVTKNVLYSSIAAPLLRIFRFMTCCHMLHPVNSNQNNPTTQDTNQRKRFMQNQRSRQY